MRSLNCDSQLTHYKFAVIAVQFSLNLLTHSASRNTEVWSNVVLWSPKYNYIPMWLIQLLNSCIHFGHYRLRKYNMHDILTYCAGIYYYIGGVNNSTQEINRGYIIFLLLSQFYQSNNCCRVHTYIVLLSCLYSLFLGSVISFFLCALSRESQKRQLLYVQIYQNFSHDDFASTSTVNGC